MPRPLKDPAKKAVQATVRLSVDAWARIDELRAPGETRAAAIEAMIWRDAQGVLPLSDGSNIRTVEEKRKAITDEAVAALRARVGEPVTGDSAPLVAQEVVGPSTFDVLTSPAAVIPGNCRHAQTALMNSGMRRCLGCEAVRGVDGVWRVL
jgi:hypothetical protein